MFVSPWVYSSWKWGGSQEFHTAGRTRSRFFTQPIPEKTAPPCKRNDWRRGGKGGKGVGDDEATQVPAASAKMESGRATTDSDSERERARKGGEGERGKRRPTSLPVF